VLAVIAQAGTEVAGSDVAGKSGEGGTGHLYRVSWRR
jgi:hypothetical protein